MLLLLLLLLLFVVVVVVVVRVQDSSLVPREEDPLFTLNDLKSYIQVVKSLNPELTSESNQVLQAYYKKQRLANTNNQGMSPYSLARAYGF
jgi:DNA replicative helicase MCM subunit Mcm2 (Cdc46/Mcm family)